MAKAKKAPVKAAPVVATMSHTEKNRQARIARHLRKHPEDKQAAKAALVAGTPRKASKAKGNFPKQRFPLRDDAGHVYGYAEYKTFSFAGKEFIVKEDGKLAMNPEIKEAWNEYKSCLANAAKRAGRGTRRTGR